MTTFRYPKFSANGSFGFWPPAAQGTQHSVTTGPFREVEPDWLHSGNESEERTDGSVPFAAGQYFSVKVCFAAGADIDGRKAYFGSRPGSAGRRVSEAAIRMPAAI